MQDTQLTELAGRHYLISQLLAGGVEVATPLRDRGIDLIAYADDGEHFIACPIQLKATQEARFSLYSKYGKFANILMVYAWDVFTTSPELYALTYNEAFEFLKHQGHTNTNSWMVEGAYTLRANDAWRERLSKHRMTPESWKGKLFNAHGKQDLLSANVAGQGV